MMLSPLRVMVATAPGGGVIRFVKFTESDRELAFYRGHLTQAEDITWWKAKLAAERPGLDRWSKAAAILTAAGWTIEKEEE